MKLSQKLLKYDTHHLTPPPASSGTAMSYLILETYRTPTPGSSGTTMSFKTPGRDFGDRWSLDRVPDVGS